jgi:hypothetical protein
MLHLWPAGQLIALAAQGPEALLQVTLQSNPGGQVIAPVGQPEPGHVMRQVFSASHESH